MNHLLAYRRASNRGRRRAGLRTRDAHGFGNIVRPVLRLATPFEHDFFVHANARWVTHVQIGHGQFCADIWGFFVHFAQYIAHGDGHVAKINVHRARFFAAMADRAMVGHVFKLRPVCNRHATAGLLFIQKRFDEQ